MFPRLAGSIGADTLMGASTTIRTAFPNSRLETLQQPPHHSHNHFSHNSHHHHQQQQHQHQQHQQQQQQHQQEEDDDYERIHQQHQQHQQYSPYHRIPASPIPITTTENQLLSPPYDGTSASGSASAASQADGLSNSNSATATITATSNRNQLLLATAGDNDDEWWSNAIEEDTFDSPLAFDASENGLWNGRFVPPPPRPPYLDESVAADGLTTCDLCTWAWQRNAYSLDGSIDTSGELGWAFTLIIVSILSALIGAIVMVIVLRCKRIKTTNGNGRTQAWWCRHNRNNGAGSGGGGGGGSGGGGGTNGRASISIKHSADSIRRPTSNSGVWTWLGGSRRSSEGPDQIGPPSSSPAENHYTHMDDAYSPVGVSEALYAELDRESVRSANPSYQNTGYSQCTDKYNFQQNEQDIPMVVSSAPSSAYYSDLSVTAVPGGGPGSNNERAYEIVGLTVMSQPLPHWDTGGSSGSTLGIGISGISGISGSSRVDNANNSDGFTPQRRTSRLAAINETSTITTPIGPIAPIAPNNPAGSANTASGTATTVPSDYV